MKIDQRKRYYVTLDTETLGLQNPSIYDFGWAIHDKKGNIFHSENYLIEEVYQPKRMATAYYANKVPLYEQMLADKEISILPFQEVMKRFDESIKDFPKVTIGAYNLPFDLKAIGYTKKELGLKGKLLSRPAQLQDIRSLCIETICNNHKGFEKFAVANNLLTAKGYLSTTAEALYKYYKQTSDFIESHTALSDVVIEIELWAWALRQAKKYTKVGVSDNFSLLRKPA